MVQESEYLEVLGLKFTELRKEKGFTQGYISNEIGIQRSSYALMEAGKRNIGTYELFKLSLLLGFSLNETLSEVFGASVRNEDSILIYEKRRMFSYNKFKNVFIYILDKCKSKPNVGKVVLNKLLYYSDFDYYMTYREYLTGLRYSKLPKGPVPGIDQFVIQMRNSGEIKEVNKEYHQYKLTKYIALIKPDLTFLTESELNVIDRTIEKYADMSAKDISNLSHEDPPWLETPSIGDEIDYNLVFKRKEMPMIK